MRKWILSVLLVLMISQITVGGKRMNEINILGGVGFAFSRALPWASGWNTHWFMFTLGFNYNVNHP